MNTIQTHVSLDFWYYREVSKYKYTIKLTYRFFTKTLITQLYVKVGIWLEWEKHLSKRRDVDPWINIIPPLEGPVQSQENERTCISIVHLFLRFLELTVWYLLVFILMRTASVSY